MMQSFTFIAEGRPRAKGRPRMTRRGRAYTPQATHEAESALASQYVGPVFDGPIAVEIDYHKDHQQITLRSLDQSPTRMTADLDNLVKLTLDALQGDPELPGTAFADDRQVVSLKARKLH